jgi:hypothetical protein
MALKRPTIGVHGHRHYRYSSNHFPERSCTRLLGALAWLLGFDGQRAVRRSTDRLADARAQGKGLSATAEPLKARLHRLRWVITAEP